MMLDQLDFKAFFSSPRTLSQCSLARAVSHPLISQPQPKAVCFAISPLPSVQEAGMPWGAECFCLLMAYLKGPERKKKQKCTSGVFPPILPTGRFCRMRGKSQHTPPWFTTALGMGLQAGDLLALRVSSPKASSTLCMAEENQRWEQNSLNSIHRSQPRAQIKPTQLSLATQQTWL